MFQRLAIVVSAIVVVLGTLTIAPSVAGAAENNWEFYGAWGVTDLASDRQTRNNIYVYEIENINGTVYIGGAFQKVVHRDSPNQPIDQAFLVAFDAASGDIISSFRPDIDHPVYAISEHPITGSILVGGEFTRVNGVERTALVALDPVTGETDTSFGGFVKRNGGNWRAIVRGIDDDGSNIYVGGSFGRAKGAGGSYARTNVAKFDWSGRVDPVWNVNVSGGGIWDLVLSTDEQRVIFGGLLNRVNGISRPGLAMVGANGGGVLTSAFPNWQSVSPYCYTGYPGCILVYDLDVQNGRVLVAAAEHFSSLHDDTTGQRLHMWPESNDTQAGLLDGNRVWRTRHGSDNTTGMYYAHDLNSHQPLVTTVGRVATGAGGFEIEKGESDCVWIGGAIGGMDLATIPGSQKVATHHVGFMCPAGTQVPESTLTIDNWDIAPGLIVRGFQLEAKGRTFGVYSYTPAPDAVRHEVFLDGEYIDTGDDGSFAFSHLEAGTSYRVKVRATDANGETYVVNSTLVTDSLAGPRLDMAPGVSVEQIADYSPSYPAQRANDENTGNISITKYAASGWWQMDLGSSQQVGDLELWARNGVPGQTRNVHVLVSDQPFVSDNLADAQAQSSVDVFLAGNGQRPATASLNTTGRYVRLQISDTNYLSIAEVNVWGVVDPGAEIVPHPNPFPVGVQPPPNGNLVCDLDVQGIVVEVNWAGTTSADSIVIYRTPDGGNQFWRGKVASGDGTFAETLGNSTYTYEIVERTGSQFGQTFDCGDTGAPPPPPPPPVNLACEVDEAHGEAVVSWTGSTPGIDAVVVYRSRDNGTTFWRGKITTPITEFTDSLQTGTYSYELREKTGAALGAAVQCGTVIGGPVGPPQPTLSCSVANVGGDAVITLTGQTNADSVVIYRSSDGVVMFWRGKIDAADTSFTDSLRVATFEYEIRERTGGTNTNPVSCGSVQG